MDEISEIKQRLNIVDVVGGYVDLKRAGRNYKGLCPFHTEKTPSFMVSPELQIFKCFGCGESGDIFTFIQKMEGYDFVRSLEFLGDKAGVKIAGRFKDRNANEKKRIYEINHLTADFYHKILLKHKSGERALKYLKKNRGLQRATIDEFNLGYAPNSWDILHSYLKGKKYSDREMLDAGVVIKRKSGAGHIDKFRGRVVFPFKGIDGKVVGFMGRTIFDRDPKYLNTSDTLVFNKSKFLYGLDKCRGNLKNEGAVFVEGTMDVISAFQAGVKNVVASSGTALTRDHLKTISRYTQDITFCFDSDTAGFSAMERAIDMAESEGFNMRVIIMPEGIKDLDEYIRRNPKDVKKLISSAVLIYDFFLVSALRKYDKKDPVGKKSIVSELTPVFGRILNDVVLSHYIKELSDEVSVEEATLNRLIRKRVPIDDSSAFYGEVPGFEDTSSRISPEFYILALLIRSGFDTAKEFLYLLEEDHITDRGLLGVFKALKGHIQRSDAADAASFDVDSLVNEVGDNHRELVQDLLLWDIDALLDDEKKLYNEIKYVYSRLEKDAVRRELSRLSEKLKIAELSNNEEEVKSISKEINEVSKKLI